MDFNDFSKLLIKKFSFQPTDDQRNAIVSLSKFLTNTNKEGLYILKGYAGTGKTSLMESLANNVKYINFKICLLAPTGRAAKVLSNYTKKNRILFIKKYIIPLSIDLVNFKQH